VAKVPTAEAQAATLAVREAPVAQGIERSPAEAEATGSIPVGRMLETFPNPGVTAVEMTSDELTALGPGNAQPDMYVARIAYRPDALCLESKSLKLYLGGYRNEEAFCETLAVRIKNDIADALQVAPGEVAVTLTQKSRGGIVITATA
jgi:7-cyano-7-deazaguanine reductase